MDTVTTSSSASLERPSPPAATARRRFIENMGNYMEAEGLPRIAGRLFGLVMLETEPVSFGDLAKRLDISRGSVSTNIRLLEGMGVVERIKPEGERQDFFRLTDQPYVNLIRGVAQRMEETLRTVAETEAVLAQEDGDATKRLAEARRFFETAVLAMSELSERLIGLSGERESPRW